MKRTTNHCTRVSAPATSRDPDSNPTPNLYDGNPQNPDGRAFPDRGESGPKVHRLLKCKSPIILSTLNVRTIMKPERLQELVHNAKQHEIDVIGIQEHRLQHTNSELEFRSVENYQLITSAYRNRQGSTSGGIGFLLSPKAVNNMLHIEKISDRIMLAEFESNPKMTIISCYSPTNMSEESEAKDFYKDLKGVAENIPAHNFLVIAGDFNAQVGPEDASFSFNVSTNRNGHELLDFVDEFQLVITNTKFMKPASKLWTHRYPTGARSRLDYILVRNKWKNSIKNAQAYSSFASVGSDHRIVSCTINLSLRASKKPVKHPMKQIDWRAVSSCPELTSIYAINVHNRFEELSKPGDDIDTQYQNIITATEEVALHSLPKQKKTKLSPISSHSIVNKARENVQAAVRKYQNDQSEFSRKAITKAQRELDEAYLTAETEFIQGKISQLERESITKQHASAWKTINEITGRKSKPSITIKGGSQEKRKENWLAHFRNLLGNPATTPDDQQLPKIQISESLDISTEPFTIRTNSSW